MGNRLKEIRDAGVIGCGGAGFPTHAKLAAAPRYLIVNAMECEPILGTDRYLMRTYAVQLIAALVDIANEINAQETVIAIKETYKTEIEALRYAIEEVGEPIEIKTVPSFYPAGDEQVVVHEATGSVVPPLGLPIEVGSVVMNVATLLACYNAFFGQPFTHRFLSVAGAVKNPCIVFAPIGTSFAECIAAAGGIDGDIGEMTVISGGPMMGKLLEGEDLENAVVEKTTGGILILPKARYHREPLQLEKIRKTARTSCIQCTNCTEMCPRHLLGHPLEPHKIMRMIAHYELSEVLSESVIQSAQMCSECGVCEMYACPMGLKPRSVNGLIKRELAKNGIRYPKPTDAVTPHSMRRDRLVPSHRLAARIGISEYYGGEYNDVKILEPAKLSIPVKQGIGAKPDILVNVGDIVRKNQRIAHCADGKLGSHVNAPFSGVVTEVGDRIVIER